MVPRQIARHYHDCIFGKHRQLIRARKILVLHLGVSVFVAHYQSVEQCS
jgi:hypothetical protein